MLAITPAGFVIATSRLIIHTPAPLLSPTRPSRPPPSDFLSLLWKMQWNVIFELIFENKNFSS
jgi:hypothetical protein